MTGRRVHQHGGTIANTVPTTSHKIGFVSLGCPKALVDSERILTGLRSNGYNIVATYQDADLVIVNTCGFIDSAREESLDSISEAVRENGKVIVTGCLGVQKDMLKARFPQLMHITGPQQYQEVLNAVSAVLPNESAFNPYLDLVPKTGIKLTPAHYSYLKIAEGCNHKCSFCIIPSMRGPLQSRPIDEVLNEAEDLVSSGVKELLVISQDTSAYGADIRFRKGSWRDRDFATSLAGLCEALSDLSIWIRLHYVYPYPHVDNVIPLMQQGGLLPYLDVPFQHGSPAVLKRMRRPASAENTLKRIFSWRHTCPELVIRSTFIVGFPGETEQEFQELLDFLREAQLDRVGCFQYSPVDGAAANQLENHVPDEVKEQRWHEFMQVQAEISRNRLASRVGTMLEVIVDDIGQDQVRARSYADAPDIDGLVLLPPDKKIRQGDLVKVRITRAGDYDLWGEPAGRNV